ncbi:MAG: DUF2194 domain-containing protein [Maribacter sp.]
MNLRLDVLMKNTRFYFALLLLAIMFLGCQNDLYKFSSKFSLPKKSDEAPLVQFIVDGNLYDNTVETKNLGKALEYSKIPYTSVSVDNFNETPIISATSRVLSVHETIGLQDQAIDSIVAFVARGGTLHVSKTIIDARLHYLMGIRPEADISIDKEAVGFYFNKPLFPDKAGFRFADNTAHLGYESKNFDDGIQVMVSAANNSDYPVLYINPIGKGKVVVFNSGRAFQKSMRGFMFASILSGLEGIPYPVANVAAIFLDDFPAPILENNPNSKTEERNKKLNTQWWPTMNELAKRHGIKYSAFVTFTEDDNVIPPFEFSDWDEKTTALFGENTKVAIGKELLKNGHELGYHGYNQVPLLAPDWKSAQNMVNAHIASEKKWRESEFQSLPMSYVPQQNIIDSIGLKKLSEGMSSLRFLQSSFYDRFEKGGNREFDPDPWNNRFFDFPRVSNGYEIGPDHEWNIESLYLYTGIWSHFINKENTKKWSLDNRIIDAFDSYLSDYKNRHPFTRFLNASQSSGMTINWRYAAYSHTVSNGFYEVESYDARSKSGSNYWLMYVDRAKESFMDESLENETWEVKKVSLLQGSLYSIKTTEPFISVLDVGGTDPTFLEDDEVIVNNVFEELKFFSMLKNSMFSFEDQLVRYDVDDQLIMATNLIEGYLRINPGLNTDMVLKYADYMVRQDKKAQLWKTLDEFYSKSPSASKAAISKKVNKIAPYPNKETRKIWLERQLKWNTNDKEVLLEYLDYFDNPSNAKQIRTVRKQLFLMDTSPKYTIDFVTYLISTEDKDLVGELDKIIPCSLEDSKSSKMIAMAYADEFIYSKALEWQECSEGVDPAIINEWMLNSKDFISKKETDFPQYIALLLANDRETAAQELRLLKPCSKGLMEMSYDITMLFSDNGEYENALGWSKCADGVSPLDKMTWYFELGQIISLKEFYNDYAKSQPKDDEVNQHMANLLLYNGEIVEAVKVIKEVPLLDIDAKFKQALNKEVRQADPEIQTQVSKLFINVLDPISRKVVQKTKRQNQGSSIGADYFSTRDTFEPISSVAGVYYEFYNEKGNTHRFTLTQSSMLAFELDSLRADNQGRDLFGLQYTYGLKLNEDVEYSFRGRLEKDNANQFYGQVGLNYLKKNEDDQLNLSFDVMPVQNGPSYASNLYTLVFRGNKELKINTDLTQVIALKGNYYTDSQFDALLTGRLEYNLMDMQSFSFKPLVEAAAGIGSVERRNGYPYWMAKERLLGGAGVHLKLGDDKSKLRLNSSLNYFLEKGQSSFQRYNGSVSYNISDYTKLNGGFEIYTIDNFYANVFRLGFIYKFK